MSDPAGWLDVSVTVLDEEEAERLRIERESGVRAMRRIVAEAVIWQDAAEDLLEEIRLREPLSDLAPRGGELVSRFTALRAALPEVRDAQLRRQVATVRAVLDHHAMMVHTALDLLAVDWRSERMVDQLERIHGLGEPAEWLDAIRSELTGEVVS